MQKNFPITLEMEKNTPYMTCVLITQKCFLMYSNFKFPVVLPGKRCFVDTMRFRNNSHKNDKFQSCSILRNRY